MSWEEYDRRGSDPPSEYINGRLVMMALPSREHQRTCLRLAMALEQMGLDGYEVTESWGWKIGPEEFAPDVMVHPVTDENTRFTGVPLLVVEVMSSNRAHDLVVKVQKYARGGAPNYWVVDPRDRTLTAFRLDEEGTYVTAVQADEHSGSIEIPLGDTVFRTDLRALLT